jgi:O-antigen/teichoic acid export membrane protein
MSVKKNYIYNVAYQILNLLIPLITAPYVSRVLGPNGTGINSLTLSFSQYFILFGTIGISLYGNRTIASVREDERNLKKTFWSIAILQLTTAMTAFFIYFIIFVLRDTGYRLLYIVQGVNILAAAIDVTWFFMGLEQFKKTVTRNTIIRLVALVCTFIFVRTENDVWKYALIFSASTFFGQLVMWYYVPAIVGKPIVIFKEIKKHFWPSVSLFIPQIAIQIYVVLDRTMIGMFAGEAELGYYDNAEKIVKMSLAVVTSMSTVMLPRLTSVFIQKDYAKLREYMNKSFGFINYLSMPMMFGIAAISINFAPFFFGSEFVKSGPLMMVLSLIIPGIAWGSVIGMQYLLAAGKVKEFTISVTAGAVINVAINLVFIPLFKSTGAAIATIAAETTVAVVQLYLARHDLVMRDLFKDFWKYVLSGTVMFVVIKLLNANMNFNAITLILQVSLGGAIYFVLLLILKSEMNQFVLQTVSKKFRK